MLARQQMIDTIRGVYELYGFVPLSTPAIEFLDVLAGSAGEEASQSIFRVSNPENEALGLRFDLTVPLARVIAQYRSSPAPSAATRSPPSGAPTSRTRAASVNSRSSTSTPSAPSRRSPIPRSSPGCATRCRP
jgi:hypothetical protein